MKRESFGLLELLVLAAALLSGFAVSIYGASQPTVFAVSTFQGTVTATSPGASGSAVLEEKGSDQIFSVTINNLSGVSNGTSGSFGVFVGGSNTNNTSISLIGPMNLKGTNNTWVLKYEATGEAPPQLGVGDLRDLVGLFLIIANPGFTNVVDGVTNVVFSSVLFAQIPPFTTKAEAPHYHRKSLLTVPSFAPPNPSEKGYVKTAFNGAQGRSVFDLSAFHLSGGGTYSIFIEDPPSSSIMTNFASLMISTNNLHTGTYNIDTRKGETLPLIVPTVQGLSGRAIEIRDAFGEIHLEGIIP